MIRALGIVLITGGTAMVFYGVKASESFSSSMSRFFTGSPTDKTLWLLIGGIAVIIMGLIATFRRTA